MPVLGEGALAYLVAQNDTFQDQQVGPFRDYLRRQTNMDKPALEIGPAFSPIIPKHLGFDVTIVDHADQVTLVEKYRGRVPDVSVIEPVDVIWHGELLSTLLPQRHFDSIVASHVIEHAPDFVGFLKDCSGLLTEGGAIYLIIPDRRYCFDALSPLSDPAKVIADHRLGRVMHSFESFYRVGSQIKADGEPAWGQQPVSRLDFVTGTPANWLKDAEAMSNSPTYIDNHENFFTPSSFALLVEELRFIGLTDLGFELVTRSRGPEFVAILSRRAGLVEVAPKAFAELKRSLHLNILREEAERIEWMRPALAY
jgi:hypothetical protein